MLYAILSEFEILNWFHSKSYIFKLHHFRHSFLQFTLYQSIDKFIQLRGMFIKSIPLNLIILESDVQFEFWVTSVFKLIFNFN